MILLWTCLSFGFLCLTSELKKWSQDISLKQSQAETRPWQLDSKDHPAQRKTSEASRRMRCIHNLMDFFVVGKITAKIEICWVEVCVCVCLFFFWLEDIWQLSDLKFAFSYGDQGFEMCWSSIMFLYTFLSEWFTPILCDCVQYEVALFRPSWTWVLLVVTSQYSQPNKQGFIYEVFFVWNCQWIISRLSQDYIFSSCLVLLLMIASFDNRF